MDVFGLNGELILVGGPAKQQNMSKTIQRLKDLKLAAEANNVKAMAYFTDDTASAVLSKASQILGQENVKTFQRPEYKTP